MDHSHVSDIDLVVRTREGDGEAFGILVRRYLRPALAVAWEFTPVREDAEDLVQDAFYRALRQIDRFDVSRPFAPWFFTIVRNLGRNAAAKRGRWRLVSVPISLTGSAPRADPAERSEVRRRVDHALEDLTPMQRACFRLCEMEGFARAEVAEMLELSSSTVRVHLHRAKVRLREALGVLMDDGAGDGHEGAGGAEQSEDVVVEKEAHG
jgi:RNA polymerase sigma-70 factor (ECF subfamily)